MAAGEFRIVAIERFGAGSLKPKCSSLRRSNGSRLQTVQAVYKANSFQSFQSFNIQEQLRDSEGQKRREKADLWFVVSGR